MHNVSTADLIDEHGTELQSLSLPLENFGAYTQFTGPIRTVRCYRDNALLKSILSTPGEGAVLVIDGGGALEKGQRRQRLEIRRVAVEIGVIGRTGHRKTFHASAGSLSG